MTAKERARLERLERENALLREQNDKHIRVYGDLLTTIIELRARLDTVREAVGETE